MGRRSRDEIMRDLERAVARLEAHNARVRRSRPPERDPRPTAYEEALAVRRRLEGHAPQVEDAR